MWMNIGIGMKKASATGTGPTAGREASGIGAAASVPVWTGMLRMQAPARPRREERISMVRL